MTHSASNKQKTLYCAIYTRKSTDENLDSDFTSLDSQREYCQSFIKSREGEGWQCYPEIYNDPGFSGGDMNRPALSKLLRDVKQRKFQVVVCYKYDRLSRNTRDFLHILDIFDKHGSAFVSVTQPIDTTSSVGRLMRSILMDFAQFEREMISERTRDKFADMAKMGRRVGWAPILVYNFNPETKRLEINEIEANRVREIFETYLRTKSLSATVRILEQKNIRMKSWVSKNNNVRGGSAFDRGKLQRFLRLPLYIGKITYRNNILDGEHPAIVSEDLAKSAYDLLTVNSKGTRHRYIEERKYNFLLHGMVRCACCKSTMTPAHAHPRRGQRFFYYRCESVIQKGKTACDVRSVPAKTLDDFVLSRMEILSGNKELWENIVNKSRGQFVQELPDLKAERNQIIAEIGKAEADIRNVNGVLAKEGPASPRYDVIMGSLDGAMNHKKELELRLMVTEEKIHELESQNISAETLRHHLDNFLAVFKKLHPDEQREAMQILVKNVEFDGRTKWVKTHLRPLPEVWGELTVLEGMLALKSQGPSPEADTPASKEGTLIARDEQSPSPPPETALARKGELFSFPGNHLPDLDSNQD